jgi:hypothetical protein
MHLLIKVPLNPVGDEMDEDKDKGEMPKITSTSASRQTRLADEKPFARNRGDVFGASWVGGERGVSARLMQREPMQHVFGRHTNSGAWVYLQAAFAIRDLYASFGREAQTISRCPP